MPDYLVIETTHGNELRNGVKKEATNACEAAQLVNYESGYSPERTFKVFAVEDGQDINFKEERIARAFDAAADPLVDPIEVYDESKMTALLKARSDAEEARAQEAERVRLEEERVANERAAAESEQGLSVDVTTPTP